MDNILVITGPTASGKTSVSVKVAIKNNAEIVNADSMQIYKMCDIGSAKATLEEEGGIKHHMIDIVNPTELFSTAEFKEKALVCIKDILGRKKLPVLTGGTGLYIDAIVKNMDFSNDKGKSKIRNELYSILNSRGPEFLHKKLENRDPNAAGKVHINNTRRVIRYLEILHNFKGSLEEYMADSLAEPPEYNFHIFVLWPDRELVYKRIEERVEAMIKNGLVNEVEKIISSGVKPNSQCMTGIGYKETYYFIKGKVTYKEYVEIMKRNTRRYAKRQFTWLKRYKDASFIYYDEEYSIEDIVKKINIELKSKLENM